MAVDSYWEEGFGGQLRLPHRGLDYHFNRSGLRGIYWGEQPLRLGVRLSTADGKTVNADFVTAVPPQPTKQEEKLLFIQLPPANENAPVPFQLKIR